MNNHFKLTLASLFAVLALGVSIANAESLLEVDLADKPQHLLVPVGQQSVLVVTNSASEAQTLILSDKTIVVEPGQTVRRCIDAPGATTAGGHRARVDRRLNGHRYNRCDARRSR